MGEPRAEVKNAADPKQVQRAQGRVNRREALRMALYKTVMQSVEGRAVMWDVLETCGVYRSIWHPSAAIHYNAGKQDLGHELQAMLLEVSEDLYDLMAREARARARSQARETDAAHTPSAAEPEGR